MKKEEEKNNFTKKDMEKAFRVRHSSGDLRWAYAEDEGGFLHLNPLYPFVGINSPSAYYLKKPMWKR